MKKFRRGRVIKNNPGYSTLFAVFGAINYAIPYFMWSDMNIHNLFALCLRNSAWISCMTLILWKVLFDNNKKYYAIFWCFTVMLCLPFYTTYMLLGHNFEIMWILNMVISSFLLSLLVDWVMFCCLFTIGILLGRLSYYFWGEVAEISCNRDTVHILLYVFVFAFVPICLFNREKETRNRDRIRSLLAISDLLTHQIKTSVIGIEKELSLISKNLVLYLNSRHKTVAMEVREPNVSNSQYIFVKAFESIEYDIKSSLLSIDSMLAYTQNESSSGEDKKEYFNVNDLLRDVVKYFSAAYDNDPVRIMLDEGKNFTIECNKEKFFSAIVHLLKNSRESIMEKRGHDEIFDGKIEIFSSTETLFNSITIQDNGIGISDDIREHVFDMFFTTKPETRAGLGLHFCNLIVKNIGGIISCKSKDDGTTCFVILLPQFKQSSAK
ncbi:MAG: HAMP domain-containing histidine kinase [Holosporales bacterium]|jgi:two-component system CAI-1 autoinducer sensor kinase/phosphatase CqsS|nr:HAMP domain-containing histidine kinase [Holosporales bacterium]